MSKVITFSRFFPVHHPRAGQPTYFVEKLLKGFPEFEQTKTNLISELPLALDMWQGFAPKLHTIRAGNRWKAGDKFSPRVWSGRPYCSKQIILGPDVTICKTFDFELVPFLWYDECEIKVNGQRLYKIGELAKNDGLSTSDFLIWLAGPNAASSKRKGFTGQILCWSEQLDYVPQPHCA